MGKSRPVQERGAAAMDQLIQVHKVNETRAVEVNAIMQLLIAVQQHPKVEKINERAIACVWHLANLERHPKGSELLGSQGGGQLIIAAMQNFPKNLRLQYCGAAALMSISTTSTDRRDRIVLLGGMELVFELFKDNLAHPECCAYCLAALYSFVKGSQTNCDELFEFENAKAMKIIGASMKAHPTAEQVQLFGQMTLDAIRPEDMSSEEESDEEDAD